MKKSVPLAGFILTGILCMPQASFAEEDALSNLKAKADAAKQAEAEQAKAAAPKPLEIPDNIDCAYKIPGDAQANDELLSKWAEQAAVQSFTFKPDALDQELGALKTCYTSQGWKAFNEALNTSGNLEAIRANSLTVTSHVSGTSQVKTMKDKQWKVTVPLQVTYQNKEKQLQQNLNVDLLVALEQSGSFGIMQVIAVPRQEN